MRPPWRPAESPDSAIASQSITALVISHPHLPGKERDTSTTAAEEFYPEMVQPQVFCNAQPISHSPHSARTPLSLLSWRHTILSGDKHGGQGGSLVPPHTL